MQSSTSGKTRAKNSSSRNDVTMTMPVLRPSEKPSLWTKKMATLVPPTADGVTADVNSHSMMTLNARRQPSSPSVRMRMRSM